MDKLTELEKRIDRYMHESLDAEKVALEKLMEYPKKESVSPLDILKRERFRHHTRTLTLREVKSWIHELRHDDAAQKSSKSKSAHT